MESELARKIGARYGLKGSIIGVLIAYSIITLFTKGELLWLIEVDYSLYILMGFSIFCGLGYQLGKKAGDEILIKKKDYTAVGAKYAVIILFSAPFFTGSIIFIYDFIHSANISWSSFINYSFGLVFWVMLFGFLPAILVGMLSGKWIHNSCVK